MFSTEADVRGIRVESYLETMGAKRGSTRFDSLMTRGVNYGRERCRVGLVSIKIAASPSLRPRARAPANPGSSVGRALDRSLRVQGYRALAPVKARQLPRHNLCRALVGDWSEGPAPDFGVTVSVRMLAAEEENDLYVNHPGLASMVYVLSSTVKRSNLLSHCPLNSRRRT